MTRRPTAVATCSARWVSCVYALFAVGACSGSPAVGGAPTTTGDTTSETSDTGAGSEGETANDEGSSGDTTGGVGGGGLLFVDVSEAAGVVAEHHVSLGHLAIGQAWGDYDRDGWVDLYVTDQVGPNTLYRNQGDGSFTLASVADTAALAEHTSGGAAFGDFDNDGDLDLYVANRAENTLLRNDGEVGFVDVTDVAGVGDQGMGIAAAWGDYDGDGFLDLYVANHQLAPDVLYRNAGDGTFVDATDLLSPEQVGKATFAASFLDYDNDGDLDLYVVYDRLMRNALWRNDGDGCGGWCFTDVSAEAGADTPVDGMGLAIADYDNDGDLDLYFSDSRPMTLLQNQASQGSPTFVDVAAQAGVDFDAIGWGVVFYDYDNDGWADLYLATQNPDLEHCNRLFHNLGDGTFEDVSARSGANHPGPTFGAAHADYDGDGHLDLVIGNRNEGYVLYRNQAKDAKTNHWLGVAPVGAGPVNRDAIGARVYVTTSDGRTQMQEVKSGSSFGAGDTLALHFGLGLADVERVEIRWPDGVTQELDDVELDAVWRPSYPQ